MKCVDCGLKGKGLCTDCENYATEEYIQANRAAKCSGCKMLKECDEGQCEKYYSVEYCVANARHAWKSFLWEKKSIFKVMPAKASNELYGLSDYTKSGRARSESWHRAMGWMKAARKVAEWDNEE